MKIKLKKKRILCVLLAITLVAIGYYMFQSITNPKLVNAEEENSVQQVSSLPKNEFRKSIPNRFDG
ncbi:peptidoglycan-N-acetylglucosamine deacetylase, partial [Bacillus wiedmannii]